MAYVIAILLAIPVGIIALCATCAKLLCSLDRDLDESYWLKCTKPASCVTDEPDGVRGSTAANATEPL